jgi:hypothetical protein
LPVGKFDNGVSQLKKKKNLLISCILYVTMNSEQNTVHGNLADLAYAGNFYGKIPWP